MSTDAETAAIDDAATVRQIARPAKGRVYRRRVRVCTACDQRLDTTAGRKACEASGHAIDVREQRIWWVTYEVDGRRQSISSHSEDRRVADDLLQARVRHTGPTVPVAAPQRPVTFDDAADEIVADYQMNNKRSLRTLRIRIEKHLRPVFGHQPLTALTTSVVRTYITRRQTAGASNATINRDLITLKRMCTLAVQGGTLLVKPYIPLLKEQNVRRGFFEPEQFQRITSYLPVYMRGIAAFACVTGWRTPSEILPLEWRQVDIDAGEVRLDAGTTKNGEGRVFPFTAALRNVVVEQQRIAEMLKARGITTSHVFCYTIGQKAGQGITEGGYNKAWRKARVAAGCPAKIPHDFRRTAVRNLVRAGVPERVAMQLTGHKTRAVFERYNIVSPGDLRDAVQRLDAFALAAT